MFYYIRLYFLIQQQIFSYLESNCPSLGFRCSSLAGSYTAVRWLNTIKYYSLQLVSHHRLVLESLTVTYVIPLQFVHIYFLWPISLYKHFFFSKHKQVQNPQYLETKCVSSGQNATFNTQDPWPLSVPAKFACCLWKEKNRRKQNFNIWFVKSREKATGICSSYCREEWFNARPWKVTCGCLFTEAELMLTTDSGFPF